MNLSADFQVQSDTACSLGFGINFMGRWCTEVWSEEWHWEGITQDITFLDFFPYSGGLWLWAHKWANSVVRFWCDKLTVVYIINNLTLHSECVMMTVVCTFTFHTLRFNILVRVKHIRGLDNSLARCPVLPTD